MCGDERAARSLISLEKHKHGVKVIAPSVDR